MALTPGELLIGPVTVTVDGTDMGFTTEDGVEFSHEFEKVYFRGAQSTVTVKGHRPAVDVMIKATFAQLSLAKLKLLIDTDASISSSAITPTFQPAPNTRTVVITGAGPSGGTRVITCTAEVDSVGAQKMANNEFQGVDVTFKLIGDPDDNSYYTIQDAASASSAPAPASYQKIVSGTPSTLSDGDTGVNVAAQIQATFNVSIRADQLTNGKFLIKAGAGNSDVTCTIEFGETASETDFTKVVLTPSASLSASTAYEIIIPAGLMSVDGIPSTTAASIQFTTA